MERGKGMLRDEITLTLNSPITDEQFDAIMDVDMENTPSIVFHTKNGKAVEYLKVVRCYECKHNPKKELVGCPMANLNELQRPEYAWRWKGER